MPLITTHTYFAKDILLKLKTEITSTFKDKKNIYTLFAQGFDPFIFYEFFKLRKYKLQEYCHYTHTDTFFLNLINKIKEKNLHNDATTLAILYGHLCHYILDSIMHPYIVYKTGIYYKEKPETKKYKGLHNELEMQMDAYMYERKNNTPFKNFKIHKHLITKEKLSKEIINLLNETYEETFNIKKGGTKYCIGCKNMYYSYKFLIEDKTGLKKKIYRLIDKITSTKEKPYEHFSSHITTINKNYLNEEHNTWINPWNKEKTSNSSFLDLYEQAIEEGIKLLTATHQFLNNQISIADYKKILKDNSYLTGLPWHLNLETKYLEF